MIAFFKYNFVSLLATLVDFSVFVLLSKGLGIWYIAATIIGAVSGGITAFILNRNWVFKAKNGSIKKQSFKYFMVWIGSIILNTIGIYILVEYLKTSPIAGKIITSAIVGIGFNFLMNKYFIFSNEQI